MAKRICGKRDHTTTPDLNAAYPAGAARGSGLATNNIDGAARDKYTPYPGVPVHPQFIGRRLEEIRRNIIARRGKTPA
jgi:hypothetical protein